MVKLFNDNTYVKCRLKFATDIKRVDGTTGNNQIKGQQVKLNSFTIFNTVDADILNNGNILENFMINEISHIYGMISAVLLNNKITRNKVINEK